MADNVFDIICIGAGISGVNAGYRIQENLPGSSYAILEARHEIGGTWSLFKYPGIRSDSDLHTFGFAFDPWKAENPIATAPSILSYLNEVASRHGIDKHMKFHHKVQALDWQSDEQRWKFDVLVNGSEEKTFWANFVIMGTGYYDYEKGLEAHIPGLSNFTGRVVHPQFWPKDLDYADKKAVIIGSGATAVTILPAMCLDTSSNPDYGSGPAKHVTMLQRSPGYHVNLPSQQPLNRMIRRWFPAGWANQMIRMRFLLQGYMFFYFCRLFPARALALLHAGTAKEIKGTGLTVEEHFTPAYRPWEQRMCIQPDGDFFAALRSGKADVATGHIESISGKSIKLVGGKTIDDVDLIITATGLKVELCGHAKISVDGKPIAVGEKFVWRGAMLQDVPNFAFIFGYTNASWTLGSDATVRLFVRLVKDMKRKGLTSTVPEIPAGTEVKQTAALNLNSTYIQEAVKRRQFPMSGDVAPWKPRWSYFVDSWFASWGDIKSGLVFRRVAT